MFVLSGTFNYELKEHNASIIANVCVAAVIGVVGVSTVVAVYSSWQVGKRVIQSYKEVLKRKQRTEREKEKTNRGRSMWFSA